MPDSLLWLTLTDALRTASFEFDKDKLNLIRELLAYTFQLSYVRNRQAAVMKYLT